MPRILAIDYGQKRTGIAVTDELQIIASGLTTIPSATTIDFLKDYFAKEKVEAVLIGEPKQMNGEPSQSASIIKGFVTHFTNHFPEMKVIRVDERFTYHYLDCWYELRTVMYFKIKIIQMHINLKCLKVKSDMYSADNSLMVG